MRETGRVDWFDRKLGYGFISREGGEDVFVHYTKIEGKEGEDKSLSPGDTVEFEAKNIKRRDGSSIQAFDVKILTQTRRKISEVKNEISAEL